MRLPLNPPQLLCPWTPLGTPLDTPRHVHLVSQLLQNSARINNQNDHLIITFVTNHYICNKCNNEVNFYICTKLALFKLGSEDSVSTFFGCFCF